MTLLLLVLGSVAGASVGATPRLEPDPSAPRAARLEQQTWIAESADYVVRLQRIDEAQRLALIEHRTGLRTDPFAAPPDEPPRVISFALELENRGEGSLSFNPRACWLITNRAKDLQSPMGLSDLSFSYHIIDAEMPEAYGRAGDLLFENPRILRPGESVSGLLVYRAVHPKTKWLRVELQLSLPSGDVARINAPYRRIKE